MDKKVKESMANFMQIKLTHQKKESELSEQLETLQEAHDKLLGEQSKEDVEEIKKQLAEAVEGHRKKEEKGKELEDKLKEKESALHAAQLEHTNSTSIKDQKLEFLNNEIETLKKSMED